MPSQEERQLMIENLQDSLRLVRHLMKLDVEKFAEVIGITCQTVNELEAKKIKISTMQYIAIAALIDTYFAKNAEHLTELKEIIDSDGKNYGAEYDTAFREDSLLKRWFENVIDFDDSSNFILDINSVHFDYLDDNDYFVEELMTLIRDYKVFLDAAALADDVAPFVKNLTAALLNVGEKIIVPLRSVEELETARSEAEVSQAKKFLGEMQAAGVLQIHGEETDPNFNETILSVFKRFRGKYQLYLITSNTSLAHEVLRLNDSAEEDAFKIAAGFIEEGATKIYKEPQPNYVTQENTESWTEL